LGADHLHDLLDAALGLDGADEVEARTVHSWGGLARFAGSAIHQHVAGDDTSVSVRVVSAGRIGVASTNNATSSGVAAAGARALAAARLSPPDPHYPGLAGPSVLPEEQRRFDPATADTSPRRRAGAVAEILAALGAGQEGAGAVSTSAAEVAFATTAGARLHALSTRASVNIVVTGFGVTGHGVTGHGEDAARALDELDVAAVGERAAATAAAAVDPLDIASGDHDVVLMPSAVATLVEYLGEAFSAKAVAEGRSPFTGHLGESFASPLIDLADDPWRPSALGVPFDGEGTLRSRVQLMAAGRALAVVHDRASAAAGGTVSTGHGMPAPNPWGPAPSHLVLAPGTSSVDDLIAGIERGLLITRFWYTRTVNPKRTLVTGMTRDGTFRIEGGRRVGPVRNLRYNQSILEALARCDGVGDRLHACCDEGSDIRVPALRLRSFTFTSTSDH
jgi:predicted Zn-dependent protease